MMINANKIYLENKYNVNIKYLEYESLMHALPKEWEQIVVNDTRNKNLIIYKECKLKINNIYRKLPEKTMKDIYWELITQIAERPTSATKCKKKQNLI